MPETTAPETAQADMKKPTAEQLRDYGYAPGGYTVTCHGCKERLWNLDKRAIRCELCATAAWAKAALATPTGAGTETREAAFLLDRLRDYEDDSCNQTDAGAREWYGQVKPAIARLSRALAPATPAPAVDGVEALRALSEAATPGMLTIERSASGAFWVGSARPNGPKVDHIIYGGMPTGYRTEAVDRIKGDAEFIVGLWNAFRSGALATFTPQAENAGLRAEIERIADDYIPDSDGQAPQALAEMREALYAALTRSPAEDAGLLEALKQIIAKAPEIDPGPAFDVGVGYKSHPNYDDVAWDARQEALWEVAEIARAALSRPQDRPASQAPTPSPESTLSPAQVATIDGGGDRIRAFGEAILHGDDEHRGWLTEAADAFVAGAPMPTPRGKGTSSATTPASAGEGEPVRATSANAEKAVDAAMTSCEADGHKCSCRRFGWQQFSDNPGMCNARLSAVYAALARPAAPAVDVPAERDRVEAWLQERIVATEQARDAYPDGDEKGAVLDGAIGAYVTALALVRRPRPDAILATRPTDPGGARGDADVG